MILWCFLVDVNFKQFEVQNHLLFLLIAYLYIHTVQDALKYFIWVVYYFVFDDQYSFLQTLKDLIQLLGNLLLAFEFSFVDHFDEFHAL